MGQGVGREGGQARLVQCRGRPLACPPLKNEKVRGGGAGGGPLSLAIFSHCDTMRASSALLLALAALLLASAAAQRES